jgi:hypothetical protein
VDKSEKKRLISVLRDQLMRLGASFAILLTACAGGSGSSNKSALSIAGTWTITAVSTEGHGSFSGTAPMSQSGVGLGINGTTVITASVGSISVSQTGASLTGTLTSSIQKVSYNFIGTLSGSNFTVAGSTPCSANVNQSTSISGTITSNNAQGTYTITRPSGCYYSSDAGTFVATKQ